MTAGISASAASALGACSTTLAHALLAALPVREAISTNYDRLFGTAWAGSDPGGLSVIPGAFRPDARRWLLKTQGCLSDPDRLVLIRATVLVPLYAGGTVPVRRVRVA